MKGIKTIGWIQLVGLLALASAAQEGYIVTNWDQTHIRNDYDGTVGVGFTTLNPALTIRALGFYDYGDNGLGTSHEIGLWNSGTLVTSVTVAAYTDDPLKDHFRWANLSAPLTLSASTLYVLAAQVYSGGDHWINVGGTPTVQINTTLATASWNARWANSITLTLPTDALFPGDGMLSANLSTEAIPDPATCIITNWDQARIRNNYDGTVGVHFTTKSAGLVVKAVGFYDYNDDGLNQAHDIGLWKSDGTLMASVTVASGTSGILSNHFRWVNLSTPVTLEAATVYTLAGQALSGDGDWWIDSGGTPKVTLDTGMVAAAWGRNWSDVSLTLTRPTWADPIDDQDGFGVANISTDVIIPEPASTLFLFLGAGAFWLRRRLQP